MADPIDINQLRALVENNRTQPAGPGRGGGSEPPDQVERRLSILEAEVREVRKLLGDQIIPMMTRIDERLKTAATREDVAVLSGRLAMMDGTVATSEAVTLLGGRVARLESTMATREDTALISGRIAKLDGAVDKLPTTVQLIGFIIAVLALAGLGRYLG